MDTTTNELTIVPPDSIGGALATLMAATLAEESLGRRVAGVYTFGAPRVGDDGFREIYEAELEHSAAAQEEIRQKFAEDIDRFRQLRAANDS